MLHYIKIISFKRL